MRYLKDSYTFSALSGLLSGLYPMLFYYSNNYASINSLPHFFFFTSIFLIIPILINTFLLWVFNTIAVLKRYKKYLVFFVPLAIVVFLMSQAMFLTLKFKIIFPLLLVLLLSTLVFYKQYKKVILILGIVCVLPFFKLIISIYEHNSVPSWEVLPDQIEAINLKNKPNIYLIQPDGYVGEKTMSTSPYNYNSKLYDWLRSNEFKTYNNYRSNYPASLVSNAAMFAMKQHAFTGMYNPSLELPNARTIICGKNPVLNVLKRNDYKCFFIVEDEYFQQNDKMVNYDYQNIDQNEIPFFSNDNNVKKDVFDDLKQKMAIKVSDPKFFFIEKLVPHHIHFNRGKDQVEKERAWYLSRIKSVNGWLEKVVTYIEEKDSNAVIIILADHGGWVGLKSFEELYSAEGNEALTSIYSAIAAIKWNGCNNNKGWDEKYMKSSVNVFRVLFSILNDNQQLLDYLEDNSSYNLSRKSFLRRKVRKVIDDDGGIIK